MSKNHMLLSLLFIISTFNITAMFEGYKDPLWFKDLGGFEHKENITTENVLNGLKDTLQEATSKNILTKEKLFNILASTISKLENLKESNRKNTIQVIDNLLETKPGKLYPTIRKKEAQECFYYYYDSPENRPLREDRKKCEELKSELLDTLTSLKEIEQYDNEFVPLVDKWRYVNTLLNIFKGAAYYVSQPNMSLTYAMNKAIKDKKVPNQKLPVSLRERDYLIDSIDPAESIERAKKDSHEIVKILNQYETYQQLQIFLETDY